MPKLAFRFSGTLGGLDIADLNRLIAKLERRLCYERLEVADLESRISNLEVELHNTKEENACLRRQLGEHHNQSPGDWVGVPADDDDDIPF